jgi:DNA-binding beta-propeller fold protein YncE
MKKTIFIAAVYLLASSCLKDTNPIIIDNEDSFLSGPGVFILNEGNFRSGNGSLSFFSYDSLKLFNHVFQEINKRPLGDIPYSMNIQGGKAYIVVNNSGKIEVADRNNMFSAATIGGINSPRYIAFISDVKAYVTSLYSDSITILDLVSNSISGYINIKHTSESIVTYFTSAYIAHWAGGNKIMVINTINDQVTDSIEVGMEPESMVIDVNGMLWVLCNGGWKRDHFAELIGINTLNNTIEKRFTFPAITDSPTCLQINGEGETVYFLMNGVRRMSISATGLPSGTFIPKMYYNFYKMAINPRNNEIFVTDANDFQQKGNVLRYSSEGALISVMQADIIPGGMCYKPSPDSNIE